MFFKDLTDERIRQASNSDQAFEAWRDFHRQFHQRFQGSMGWKTVKGQDYPYRYVRGVWKEIAKRSPETELAYHSFRSGKEKFGTALSTPDSRIKGLSLINRGWLILCSGVVK